MKVGVVTKLNMQSSKKRSEVIDYLLSKGVEVKEYDNSQHIDKDLDKLLVFGGDGTMLDAQHNASPLGIAILGVNLGNLGFLTTCEKDVKPDEVFNLLTNGKIIEKSLLCTSIRDIDCRKALNEMVIKSKSTRPMYIDVYIDGSFVDTYHADGVIVSTPTGSTAYSLSCGGPILAPDVNALTILPICAHSLHSRPIVINANSCIRLQINGIEGGIISVDGDYVQDVNSGDDVFVSIANYEAKFITSINDDFYSKLFQKMNSWGTTQHS